MKSIESIVSDLRGVLVEITHSIDETKRDLFELDCKAELSKAEKQKCDDLQYKMDFLEAQQNAIDEALCLLIDYI